MSLIPYRGDWLWEPWENFDKSFNQWPGIKFNGFMPAVDIYEKAGKIVAEVAISGIDPNKIDISVEDNILKIKSQNENKSEMEEKNYYRREVRYGSFYRAIPLPVKVEGEKAQAVYQDGILKIEIPKAIENKIKRLKIKVIDKNNK